MLTIRGKKKRDYIQIKSISLPNITTVRVERQAKNRGRYLHLSVTYRRYTNCSKMDKRYKRSI